MTSGKYILDSTGNPIPETDLIKWAMWLESSDRQVARDTVGDSEVSTVFLGIDHNFSRDGNPILWETMVFGGELDQDQARCSGSREQAEAMHREMKDKVIGLKPKPVSLPNDSNTVNS